MSEYPRPSGRVVVTGIGAVTPLATGIEATWAKMLAGESAIGRITHMDPSEYTTHIAAEVKDFNAEDYIDKKEARRVDRFIALAVASATMALEDSKLPISDDNREDIGVLVGSGIGGLSTLADNYKKQLESGPGKVSPFLVPYMIPDMASGYISIVHKLKGPNICSVSACSTAANCIGDAYHIVKRGDAVVMLAGGTEAPINSIGLGGFCAARALSTRNDDPSHACRPFDLNRDGFIMAEGSTVLVLEDYDHAVARGAKIYGEIVGYGMTGDAHHITHPDPEGMGAYRAIRNALHRGGIQPDAVDYVNAHGTSTTLNDKLETMAIKKALGDHAYKTTVSSTKSMVGHLLGAAGAIEAAVCLLAMRDGMVPPTINYETPDPECDLDYVPNKARKRNVDVAISNSFGFGGHNVCLAFKKLA